MLRLSQFLRSQKKDIFLIRQCRPWGKIPKKPYRPRYHFIRNKTSSRKVSNKQINGKGIANLNKTYIVATTVLGASIVAWYVLKDQKSPILKSIVKLQDKHIDVSKEEERILHKVFIKLEKNPSTISDEEIEKAWNVFSRIYTRSKKEASSIDYLSDKWISAIKDGYKTQSMKWEIHALSFAIHLLDAKVAYQKLKGLEEYLEDKKSHSFKEWLTSFLHYYYFKKMYDFSPTKEVFDLRPCTAFLRQPDLIPHHFCINLGLLPEIKVNHESKLPLDVLDIRLNENEFCKPKIVGNKLKLIFQKYSKNFNQQLSYIYSGDGFPIVAIYGKLKSVHNGLWGDKLFFNNKVFYIKDSSINFLDIGSLKKGSLSNLSVRDWDSIHYMGASKDGKVLVIQENNDLHVYNEDCKRVDRINFKEIFNTDNEEDKIQYIFLENKIVAYGRDQNASPISIVISKDGKTRKVLLPQDFSMDNSDTHTNKIIGNTFYQYTRPTKDISIGKVTKIKFDDDEHTIRELYFSDNEKLTPLNNFEVISKNDHYLAFGKSILEGQLIEFDFQTKVVSHKLVYLSGRGIFKGINNELFYTTQTGDFYKYTLADDGHLSSPIYLGNIDKDTKKLELMNVDNKKTLISMS